MTANNTMLNYLIDNQMIPFEICPEEMQNTFRSLEMQEEELPENIYRRNLNLYVKINMTEEQIKQHLFITKVKHIRTIKNCLVFFTAIAVISIVLTLLILLNK